MVLNTTHHVVSPFTGESFETIKCTGPGSQNLTNKTVYHVTTKPQNRTQVNEHTDSATVPRFSRVL